MLLRAGSRGLLVLFLGLVLPVGAAVKAPAAAQDLQYGEVLYYFYQQDYFTSMVRLLKESGQGHMQHHDSELLYGGLALSYGMSSQANHIFQELLTRDSRGDDVRNRAWLYLAKIAYQRGNSEQAIKAIEQVHGSGSKALQFETANIHSLALLDLGNHSAAIDVLEQTRDAGHWSPYLQFNLGIAQIRSNQIEQGIASLSSVGKLDRRAEEYRLLRDKANLALGYTLLQNDNAEQSYEALEHVRLEGPFSNKALLGAGWAAAEKDRYDRALIPWSELKQRRVTDPAVQESMLAIPYAMARLNLHGRAVQHYEQAIGTLETEQVRIDESIRAIRSGELLAALQSMPVSSNTGWLQTLDTLPETPALRYQIELMASHAFQEALKNYHDLDALEENLGNWATSMDAYDTMLVAREARFKEHLPKTRRALQGTAVEQLEGRYQQQLVALNDIEAREDPVRLATSQEAEQWQALAELGRRLEGLPDIDQVNRLREQQRRLKGVLLWQLSTDYKPRLWRARQRMNDLEQDIDKVHLARQALQEVQLDGYEDHDDFHQRIARQRGHIKKLQARTGTLSVAQGMLLEKLAVHELEQQKQRLDKYRIQARFALAQTYDSAQINAGDAQ
jgi:hypothetical protein